MKRTEQKKQDRTLQRGMTKAGYRMSRSLAKSWPRKKGTGTIHVQIDMTITFVAGKGFGV